MKKCRQCGLLSADTATVCRHCNFRFTEEDKPIVAEKRKNNKNIFATLAVIVTVFAIAALVLHQTGMFKTWSQSSEKAEIKIIATEFVNADFEKDTNKVRSFMFDSYIDYHKQNGTFVLNDNQYVSFYFSIYNPDSTIEVLSVNADFLEDNFQLYSDEITKKYSVNAKKIVSVTAEVKITDNEFSSTVSTPMTFIELDDRWYVLPVL